MQKNIATTTVEVFLETITTQVMYCHSFVTIKYINVILFREGSMETIHDKRYDIANKMLNFWTLTPGSRRIEENLPQRQRNQITLKYQSSKKRISPTKEGDAILSMISIFTC